MAACRSTARRHRFASVGRIAAGLLVALALGLPQSATAQAPGDALLDADEAALLQLINDFRARQGLARWQADARLQALALAASTRMAQRRRASHDGFDDRFERSGASLCVEVIAQGAMPPELAVGLWRRSPAHLRNLLEPRVYLAGVAWVGDYATVLACDEPVR